MSRLIAALSLNREAFSYLIQGQREGLLGLRDPLCDNCLSDGETVESQPTHSQTITLLSDGGFPKQERSQQAGLTFASLNVCDSFVELSSYLKTAKIRIYNHIFISRLVSLLCFLCISFFSIASQTFYIKQAVCTVSQAFALLLLLIHK